MNLTQRPEVAGLRTSIVCGHIRYRIRPAPGWRAWRGALGLPLAPFISSALRDWETRVTGKGDVPCGARAAEVGGAPPCLVELRVPAGSAEPWLGIQLQPRSIRRPFRHETQNMLGHGRDLRLGQPRKVRTFALPGQGLFPLHSLRLHANIHRKAGEV